MELLRYSEHSDTTIHQSIKIIRMLCAASVLWLTTQSHAMSNHERLFQWDINREICHMQNLSSTLPNSEKKALVAKHIRDLHLLRALAKNPNDAERFEYQKDVLEGNRKKIGITWWEMHSKDCKIQK